MYSRCDVAASFGVIGVLDIELSAREMALRRRALLADKVSVNVIVQDSAKTSGAAVLPRAQSATVIAMAFASVQTMIDQSEVINSGGLNKIHQYDIWTCISFQY